MNVRMKVNKKRIYKVKNPATIKKDTKAKKVTPPNSEDFIKKISELTKSHEDLLLLGTTSSLAIIAKRVSRTVHTRVETSIFQPYEQNSATSMCILAILEWDTWDAKRGGGELAPKLERMGCPILTVTNPKDIARIIERI